MKHAIHKMRKSDIEWLATHTCKAHQVSYLSHPNCYYNEKPDDSPIDEVVGFLDIESSHLKASFGYVFSYAIKTRGEDEILGRILTKKEILSGDFDKHLLKEFNKDVKKYSRLVVYWGKDRRHDLPFLRTRALKHRLDFPLYKDIYVTDAYDMAKSKMSLHSYRLQTVCGFLGIPSKSHPLDGDTWLNAGIGNKDALDYMWEHNKEDVICLEPAYDYLEPFFRGTRVSV